jgi:hypothetical protein
MGLTMAVFKLELDFVNSFIDSRGKPRHQFRRKGFKKVTIKGRPGSPEFMEAYQALLESTGGSPAAEIGASRTKSGTVNAVAVALYKDDVFTKGLAKATQTPFRRIIDRFREHTTPSGRVYGENGMSTLKKERILDFLAGKTANAQKNSLKAVRFLVRFAISKGELAHDPTDGIDLIKAPKDLGAHDLEAAPSRAVSTATRAWHHCATGDGIDVEHRRAPRGCPQDRPTAFVVRRRSSAMEIDMATVEDGALERQDLDDPDTAEPAGSYGSHPKGGASRWRSHLPGQRIRQAICIRRSLRQQIRRLVCGCRLAARGV